MADPNLPYDALALPNEALANGGTEILRAGIIDGQLYVTARRAFKEPAKWGDILADTARRIALLYSAEDSNLTEAEARTEILEAFAADLGARKVARKTTRAKSRQPSKKSVKKSSAKRKSVKRRKR